MPETTNMPDSEKDIDKMEDSTQETIVNPESVSESKNKEEANSVLKRADEDMAFFMENSKEISKVFGESTIDTPELQEAVEEHKKLENEAGETFEEFKSETKNEKTKENQEAFNEIKNNFRKSVDEFTEIIKRVVEDEEQKTHTNERITGYQALLNEKIGENSLEKANEVVEDFEEWLNNIKKIDNLKTDFEETAIEFDSVLNNMEDGEEKKILDEKVNEAKRIIGQKISEGYDIEELESIIEDFKILLVLEKSPNFIKDSIENPGDIDFEEVSTNFKEDLSLEEDEELSLEKREEMERKFLESEEEFYDIENELKKLISETEGIDLNNMEALEKFDSKKQALAKKSSELAKILKYSYLFEEQTSINFTENEKIERLAVIEYIENSQSLLEKSLKDMNAEEISKLRSNLLKLAMAASALGGLAGVAVKLEKLVAAMSASGGEILSIGISGTKAGAIIAGTGAGTGLAALVLGLVSKMNPETVEDLTGVPAPKWLKNMYKKDR